MIGISTLTQNTAGHLMVHEKKTSAVNNHPARVSRTKILNGGVYINHSGVTDGDRTLTVIAEMTDAQRNRLLAIHKTETLVHVATRDGHYTAAISDVRQQKADTVFTILIKEKESE